MKLRNILIALVVLCTGHNPVHSKPRLSKLPDKEKSSIIISSGENCKEIANSWAITYGKAKVQPGSDAVSKGDLKHCDFTIVSNVINHDLIHEAPWKIVLAHNPIVPIISLDNPHIKTYMKNGMSVSSLKSLIIEGTDGSEILIEDNPSTLNRIIQFSGIDLKKISEAGIVSSDKLMASLSSNANTIGFVRVSEILNSDDNTFISGFTIIPIDKNNNGAIDDFEKIYQTSSAFLRGVWIGKYPKVLGNDLYLLASQEPDEAACEFVNFLLEDGQKTIEGSGFIALSGYERIASTGRIGNIASKRALLSQSSSKPGIGIILGLILIGLIIMISLINFILRRSRKTSPGHLHSKTGFSIGSLLAPQGFYFDKSHTWAFLEKNGSAKIGVDDFLLHVSGEITRIQHKKIGDKVMKGERIMTISQQGKQIHLKSPISGTIDAENLGLSIDPTTLTDSPFENGWVLSITPKSWQKESQLLLMADSYKEWLNNEFSRLKEFLQSAINTHQGSAQLILQDGGEITDKPLSQLGPEIWEDFQTQFIDQLNS